MERSALKKRSTRPVILAVAVSACLLLAGGTARGQTGDGVRLYQEQLRVQLDEQAEQQGVGLDAGGWATVGIFHYDDSLGEDRTLRQVELRAWGSANIDGVHKFYVRGLTGWNDWNTGDSPRGHGDEDVDPLVERAWYELDVARFFSGQPAGVPQALEAKMKVGREFADIGTAFVLSMPLDLIRFDVRRGHWQAMALLGKSVPWVDNIDTSYDVVTHQDRCFWGFQVAYDGFQNHRPFAYFLATEDHSRARPRNPNQKYQYNSRYVGVGSAGSVFLPDLRYQAELVGEFGHTYGVGAVTDPDQICAFGADLLLEYFFHVPARPKVSFEYMYGSGDDDRLTSSSSTDGGNTPGTKDHAFNAFGFRDTGTAFAPEVSNLHIYTVGASFLPFENNKLLKRMELGVKTYFYQKAQPGGPVSDTTGFRHGSWVGWEGDVYCDWRITSDLIWTIRYGGFQPGDVFVKDDCRQMVFTALTYSF
jgi:hypothetical protein